MYKDLLKEREHGEEEQYARRRDAELIQKLRERAHLHELTETLARKLEVDDPALLQRIIALGITRETGPAFLLVPLVRIAWAEGKVEALERAIIFDIARERGIAEGSTAWRQLQAWLTERPSLELHQAALEAIRAGISVLPQAERADRVKSMTALCHRVAGSSGGLARFLGIGSGIAREEHRVLAAIEAALR